MAEPSTADGFDAIAIRSADGSTTAEFIPAVNMLCCSLRHRDTEFLDLGRGVEVYAQRGSTLGIPLLHPWANRLAGFEYRVDGRHVVLPRDGEAIPIDHATGLPIHGVMPSLLRWEAEQRGQDALTARLQWSAQELLEVFPFPHRLEMDVHLGPGTMTITTTLIATGAERVPVSFGYHPYLRVPDAPRETWHVTTSALNRLELDKHMIPTGERRPAERRELDLEAVSLDDGFEALTSPVEFIAGAAGGQVGVQFTEGFPFAQIYAPPDKQFICFEPMTAPTNALNSGDGLQVVAPDDRYVATFTITVR